MFVFLILYAFRLSENFFIRAFVWQAEPITAFALLIGGAIIPGLVLQRLVSKFDDRSISTTLVSLSIIFLVGLALNWDSLLVASQITQASLEKLNPIGLGFVASSLAIFFVLAPSTGVWRTGGKYVLLIFLIGVTIFSKSRGPLLAALLALCTYGLLTKSQHRKNLMQAVILIGLVVGMTPMFIGVDLFVFAFDRFATMGVSDGTNIDASAEGRVVAWNAAWAQFLENPVLGDKVFEPTLMHYPHNLFLESLISLGVVGTCLLIMHIVFCGTIIVRIFRRPDSSLAERYIALIAIKEFVAVQVSSAIWSGTTFWIASACVIGVWVKPFGSLRHLPRLNSAVS
jgi:O-antigen ligase